MKALQQMSPEELSLVIEYLRSQLHSAELVAQATFEHVVLRSFKPKDKILVVKLIRGVMGISLHDTVRLLSHVEQGNSERIWMYVQDPYAAECLRELKELIKAQEKA